MNNFLEAQTVAALGATNRLYTKKFSLDASVDGQTGNSQGSDSIVIQSGHHFFTERVFIGFPSIDLIDDALIDTGACYQYLQLQTNEIIQIFNNPVLISLIGVPGRQMTPGATNPDGSQVVQFAFPPQIEGFPFNLFLSAGSSFIHTFTNYSQASADIEVVWQGWDFLVEAAPSSKDFWNCISVNQTPPSVN